MGGLGEEVAEKCSEAQALSGALVPRVTWVEAARGMGEREESVRRPLQGDPSAVRSMVGLSEARNEARNWENDEQKWEC